MKKMILFVALMVAVALSGCSGSEEPNNELPIVASIATFDGSANGLSTFSYTEGDGSPVKLTAAWNAPEELKEGMRVLLYYRAAEYGVSADIALVAVTRIPTGKVTVAPRADIPAGVDMSQTRVWRSGRWINLGAVVTFSGDARAIDLTIDRATLSDTIAQAYVVVLAEPDARPSAERQLYASWDADSVLSIPGLRGINVNLSPTKSVIIRK